MAVSVGLVNAGIPSDSKRGSAQIEPKVMTDDQGGIGSERRSYTQLVNVFAHGQVCAGNRKGATGSCRGQKMQKWRVKAPASRSFETRAKSQHCLCPYSLGI